MLTVVSWLWSQPGGRTIYKPEHVWIWASMVERHLKMPHKLLCVTSETDLPPNVERVDPPGEFEDITPKWGAAKPNCFRRLVMFRKNAAKTFGRRFVSMDIDCAIGGPLDPLFDRPDDFVICKGTDQSRPYNGSMMLLKAGSRPQVYDKFDQSAADVSGSLYHGSDQAWLMHCLGPNEATWGEADGVWSWNRYMPNMKKAEPTILFFPGKWKPWNYERIFPFIKNNYRMAEKEAA